MFCESCGAKNDAGHSFCTGCGAPLILTPQPDPAPTAAPASSLSHAGFTLPAGQPVSSPDPGPLPPDHVSTAQWVGILCLNLIPLVGPLVFLILLFVWAFGDTPKRSLKTFARAYLLFCAVVLGLAFLLLIGLAVGGIFSYLPGYFF